MDGAPTLDTPVAHDSRLVALSPDLLGAAGFDGFMKALNPAWSSTLGWSEEHLRATPYLEFVHPDDRAAAIERIGRLAGGETVTEFVCRIALADGGHKSILWSAQAGLQEGCFYLAGKDITDRRQMEVELELRAERLERTNAELQEFAYIASHDLAEPLRMITSYLELLQRRYEGRLDETADQFIGFAVGGAERMRTLIEDLLAYSRVGSHQLERSDVDLAELLGNVLRALERAIADAEAVVDIHDVLPVVSADRTQLGQLLQNLISNAVKFRAPGRLPHVEIRARTDEHGVTITVTDNGIGIAANQQERIFKMFARLHGRDEYEGTGIGLALCRRIVERHGGRITVESTVGEGTTFRVQLPSR